MKKGIVLNSQVSAVIANMGHFDLLGVGDAGMPVPAGIPKIDLAVTLGLPRFIPVVENILAELEVQRIYLAEEIKAANPDQLAAIQQVYQGPVTFIPHAEMKRRLGATKAFIRTGEATPFSNVLLESGVVF